MICRLPLTELMMGLRRSGARRPRRRRVGGVDLQRQQRGALELLGRLLDDLDLVDLGQAHVHVQDIGTLLLLADALAYDVVQVAVAQGLLQALFAGGLMRSPMTAILWPSQGRSTTVWALVTDMLGLR